MMNDGVRNLLTALSTITEPWQPHRLASVNDYDVKIVKIHGEFVWHTHPETDELFLVLSGELTIQLRDGDVVLGPNDVFVVPKGVEHCPKAAEEVQAVLIEPRGTVNTGDAGGEMTAQLRELGAPAAPTAAFIESTNPDDSDAFSHLPREPEGDRQRIQPPEPLPR